MDIEVREINAPNREEFEAEILQGGQPVVMRGLVAHWPGLGQSALALFNAKCCARSSLGDPASGRGLYSIDSAR